MWIHRAFALLRGVRCPARFTAPRMLVPAGPTSSSDLTWYCNFTSGFPWKKRRLDLILGIVLSGQAVYFLGSNENLVFAQDSPVAEVVYETDQGQTHIPGLTRIEDGSIISNAHTSKWRIYTDKGRELFLKGQLNEAENFFHAALEEAKKGFGLKDPHVASSCNNLAEFYRVKREYEKAEPLYLEAISTLEEAYGVDDVRVGAALHNLGLFYLSLRKLEQAQKCFERALKIKGRVLGSAHFDYAATMYYLGRVLHLQQKEKEAEDLMRESIRIMEDAGLGESKTCLLRMKYLAQVLLNTNQFSEAENLQRKILHILELAKGWDSLDTVIAAENLALTLQSLEKLNEAEELLERCLDAKQKILPKNHVQVATNMLKLARLAMLKTSNLRKMNISEAGDALDKANILLHSAIRIANHNLSIKDMNQDSAKNSIAASETDQHVALITLLQSLDSLGLLELKKRELAEPGVEFEYSFQVELPLRECLSIFKEPFTRSMVLNFSDAKKEYLTCLKHLMDHATIIIKEESNKSRVLKELVDEAKHIEAELAPTKP